MIVAYCVRGLEKLQPSQVAAATELGFVLPRFVSDTVSETAELGVAVQAPGGAPSSPSFGQSPAGQVEDQAKAFSGGAGQVSPACSSAVLDFPHQVPRPSGQAALSSDSLPEVRALPDHPPSAVLDFPLEGLDAKLPAGLVDNLPGLRSTPSCGEPPEPESTHSPAGQVAGQAQAFSGGAGLNCAESPFALLDFPHRALRSSGQVGGQAKAFSGGAGAERAGLPPAVLDFPSLAQRNAGQVGGQAEAFSGGAGPTKASLSSAVLDFPQRGRQVSGQASGQAEAFSGGAGFAGADLSLAVLVLRRCRSVSSRCWVSVA